MKLVENRVGTTVLNLLTNWLRLLADFMTEPSRAMRATSLHWKGRFTFVWQAHRKKFENLCVELWSEPARLQHRQAMGKSANLQNISKSGLTIKCCRLYEYARFCTCLMISWLWGSSPFSTARTYSKTSLTLGSTIRCWTGRERSLRLTHPACQHLNCWMLGHEVIRSPEEKTN